MCDEHTTTDKDSKKKAATVEVSGGVGDNGEVSGECERESGCDEHGRRSNGARRIKERKKGKARGMSTRWEAKRERIPNEGYTH